MTRRNREKEPSSRARGRCATLALLALGAALLACGGKEQKQEEPPPVEEEEQGDFRNVILISIDTLRADHVGCYGYGPPTTPAIDELAARSALFENAYAVAPWTLPSHASMLTGVYPPVHGADKMKGVMSDTIPTMATILKKHGYRTHAVLCAQFLKSEFGLSRGFDVWDDEIARRRDYLGGKFAEMVTDKAIAALESLGPGPFFLKLHYWDPHHPYNPARRYVKMFDPGYKGKVNGKRIRDRKDFKIGMPPRDLKHLIALYDGEIRYTDDAIARLFDFLDSSGLADNTMIVLVSDHGEEFLEHGGRAHLAQCWQETLHVPFIVHVPWSGAAPRRYKMAVSHIDILPTVVDFLGVTADLSHVQGVSLEGKIMRREPHAARQIFAETRYGQVTNDRSGPNAIWTVVYSPNQHKYHRFPNKVGGFERVYDLKLDPGEQEPIAEKGDSEVRKSARKLRALRRVINSGRAKFNRPGKKNKQVKLSDEAAKRLEALGYIE